MTFNGSDMSWKLIKRIGTHKDDNLIRDSLASRDRFRKLKGPKIPLEHVHVRSSNAQVGDVN